jgi:hypothetical protein
MERLGSYAKPTYIETHAANDTHHEKEDQARKEKSPTDTGLGNDIHHEYGDKSEGG